MKKNIVLMVLLFLFLAFAGFAAFQYVGGKKGNDVPQKKDVSEKAEPPQQSRADAFSNGQIYKVFVVDNFEVKYPDWPNIDLKNVPDAGKIKVAVTDQNCVFMVKIADIPAGTTFKANTEKLLADQAEKISKTLIREVGDRQAHFEGEVIAGKAKMKNVSYTYLVSGNQSAGIAFAANVDNFDGACQPIIDEVIASVVAK